MVKETVEPLGPRISCTARVRGMFTMSTGGLTGLRDRNDAVTGLQQTASRGRPARHQLEHLAVSVVALQRGADSEQREIHRDGEALHLFVPEIVGVGIVDVRQRVQIDLEHLVAAERLHGVQLPARACASACSRSGPAACRPASPAGTPPGAAATRASGPPPSVARPSRVLAIERVDVVPGEVELRGLEHVAVVGHLLVQPLRGSGRRSPCAALVSPAPRVACASVAR